MTICVAGKNRCAMEAIVHAKASGFKVVHLPNKKPGHEPFDPPCSVVDLPTLYEIEDLILYSLESDHIFKPHLFKDALLFNFHFSLLPKYRGCHTTAWQVWRGEIFSGVTMHIIDKGIDTGPIIGRVVIGSEGLTAGELYSDLQDAAVNLFAVHLGIRHRKGTPQDESKATYYPLGSFDFKQQIDMSQSPEVIACQINSLVFPAFQVPMVDGRSVYAAWVEDGRLVCDYEP